MGTWVAWAANSDKRQLMSIAFSGVPSPATCRSRQRTDTHWSSTLYGEIFVKGVPQESYPIYLRSVSLFDLVAVSSSRPTRRRAGARRGGQGWPHLGGHRRLGLGRHRARRQTW